MFLKTSDHFFHLSALLLGHAVAVTAQGKAHTTVAQQYRHGAHIGPQFESSCGKAVAQAVKGEARVQVQLLF